MHFLVKNGLVLVFMLANYSAQAWWDQGHQLIAEIAQDAVNDNNAPFLSRNSRDSIQNLLNVPISNPGSIVLSRNTSTFTKSASWADGIKSYQEQGKNYPECHFINVPIKQLTSKISYQAALAETENYYAQKMPTYNSISCIMSAIKTLKAPQATTLQKAISLRMITHLIGDLSQPLHNVDYYNDRGGNELILVNPIPINSTDGSPNLVRNMHFLWDSTFGHFPQYVYSLQKEKLGNYSPDEVNSVVYEAKKMVDSPFLMQLPVNYEENSFSIMNLSANSYMTAQNNAYYKLSFTGNTTAKGLSFVSVDPDSDYFRNNVELIESILYTGGVHLAKLLTAIFDPASAERGYVTFVNEVIVDKNISLFPPS